MWWGRSARRGMRRRTRRTCTLRFRSSIPTSDGGEGPRSIHFWSGAIPHPSRADLQVGLSLFLSEAIQVRVTARRDQVVLAATLARVNRVPRRVRPTQSVVMTDHDRPLRAARVVVARHVLASGKCAAVGLRAREDVVLVGLVADAVD